MADCDSEGLGSNPNAHPYGQVPELGRRDRLRADCSKERGVSSTPLPNKLNISGGSEIGKRTGFRLRGNTLETVRVQIPLAALWPSDGIGRRNRLKPYGREIFVWDRDPPRLIKKAQKIEPI